MLRCRSRDHLFCQQRCRHSLWGTQCRPTANCIMDRIKQAENGHQQNLSSWPLVEGRRRVTLMCHWMVQQFPSLTHGHWSCLTDNGDLGVTIEHDLNWKSYVTSVRKRALRVANRFSAFRHYHVLHLLVQLHQQQMGISWQRDVKDFNLLKYNHYRLPH